MDPIRILLFDMENPLRVDLASHVLAIIVISESPIT